MRDRAPLPPRVVGPDEVGRLVARWLPAHEVYLEPLSSGVEVVRRKRRSRREVLGLPAGMELPMEPRFAGVELTRRPACELVAGARPGELVYLDLTARAAHRPFWHRLLAAARRAVAMVVVRGERSVTDAALLGWRRVRYSVRTVVATLGGLVSLLRREALWLNAASWEART